MPFAIVPAHRLSLGDQASIFNQAFAGYLAGSKPMDEEAFSRLLCAQGVVGRDWPGPG